MLQFIICNNYRYDNKYFINNWYINNKILVLNKIIKVYMKMLTIIKKLR